MNRGMLFCILVRVTPAKSRSAGDCRPMSHGFGCGFLAIYLAEAGCACCVFQGGLALCSRLLEASIRLCSLYNLSFGTGHHVTKVSCRG